MSVQVKHSRNIVQGAQRTPNLLKLAYLLVVLVSVALATQAGSPEGFIWAALAIIKMSQIVIR